VVGRKKAATGELLEFDHRRVGAAAEGEKALRLRREQREREQQEEQRRRWEEEERRRKEEEKIKHLEKVVANWNQSRRIREFLSEVEKAATENPAKKTENLSDWLSWAHAYADSIDPIHLTFHSERAAGKQQ
jgi:hypothetical protein